MFDFLKPRILEQIESEYSGWIKVVKSMGDVYIATGPLTQSGGLVREVWDGVLKKFGRKNRSWLILGLAGGTIAKMISDRQAPKRLVGVEIDPVMVFLGKKYLGLEHIPNLEIVNQDAGKYIRNLNSEFDYILVDMYLGDKLPEFVYSDIFLSRLAKNGRTVIFNHLFYDETKKNSAGFLVEKLKSVFPKVSLSRKLTNLLITCQSEAS